MKTVTLRDINVYGVTSMEYRAYVKGQADLQEWGATREQAVAKLAATLTRRGIAFDFSEQTLGGTA